MELGKGRRAIMGDIYGDPQENLEKIAATDAEITQTQAKLSQPLSGLPTP